MPVDFSGGGSGGGGSGNIESINADTTAAHLIVAGTAGNDFAIATAGGTTTVDLPTASSTKRGALSSADWTTFNAKAPTASPTFTGTVTAPDGGTWDSTGIQLANAKKMMFGGASTKFISVDSGYDTNAMRLAMPAGGYVEAYIQTTARWSASAQEMVINNIPTRYVSSSAWLGWSGAGGAPAPPPRAYLQNVYLDVGTNKTYGTATLVNGTVTVSTTQVETGDTIIVSRNTPGGTVLGLLSADTADIVNATSFKIEALDSAGALTDDDSTVNWWIIKTY